MKGESSGLIIGISIGVVIGVLLAIFALFFIRYHRKRLQIGNSSSRRAATIPIRVNGAESCTILSDSSVGTESPKISTQSGMPLWLGVGGLKTANVVSASGILEYSYKDLQKATCNFTTLIGQGAFGPVYKAQMSTGETVAVKVLATDSKQGEKEFQTEARIKKIMQVDEEVGKIALAVPLLGRILKHAVNLVVAAALADKARCMDLVDRYINSDCVKRMLQADQVALAEKTAVLFTKDGDQHNNLHDMQCMWYELASGESYFRQGDLGRALKKFLAVEKHCADITEDQFDFHTYCLRKMTLRTYVEMMKFQDRLHSQNYFRKAAVGAIRCYIRLYDSPAKSAAEENDEMSKLPPSQKKKMRQKQRKAEARAKKEAEVKNEESNASGTSKSGKRHVKPVDLDPNGEKLLQVEDPLLEATKYLKLLQKHSPDSLETHLLSFELNMRKQRILLAFQAVKQLLRLDAENPDSHRCLIRFFYKLGAMPAPVTDTEKLIWAVLEAERPTLSQLHEKSLLEANTFFLEKHKDSLMHRAAVAEMVYVLDPSKKDEAIKLLEDSSNNLVPTNGALGPVREWKLKDCIAVHKLLGTNFDDRDAALRWKVRCAGYFPYSTYFEGSCSSAVHNSAYNQISTNPENGGSTHKDAAHGVASISSNGKLEKLEASFKDLII